MQKILIVGATGNLGTCLARELADSNHVVSALLRPASMTNDKKRKPLKDLGIGLIAGDLNDQGSLDRACQGQDVVLSAAGGGEIMLQENLAKAAAKAGVSRFIPSEFGVDPLVSQGQSCDLFNAKAAVQDLIKKTGVPTTMIYANGFMEFWGAGLGQLGAATPPSSVQRYSDGRTEAFLVTLADIAKYTRRILEDPNTVDKEVCIRANKTSQEDLIQLWEELSGKEVDRTEVSPIELDHIINGATSPEAMMTRIFSQLHRSLWVRGETLVRRPGILEAATLYPDIQPVSIKSFFQNFLT